jgi:hypothetical protein
VENTITSNMYVENTITTQSLHVDTVNGYPYGFSGELHGISPIFSSSTITNSSLFTVPQYTSTLTFTLIGGGGGGSIETNGGNGSYVKLQILNPTANSIFALYPGTSNTINTGGGMSMIFSTNNTTYACMAIAGGGGGAGIAYNGASGGEAGDGGNTRSGAAGLGGIGGIAGRGGTDEDDMLYGIRNNGYNGINFSTIANPPIFLNTSFTTITVNGYGGGGGINAGAGGDGYGGGGGGGGANYGGGGGGGNYCYADNTTYFSTIINSGSTIDSYGKGGVRYQGGQPGVIIVDITYHATTSLYNFIPDTTQTLGTLLHPWSNTYTSSIYCSTIHFRGTPFNSIKSFIIDHPIDISKYLVHACLEGPEVGVYYRGTSEIETGHTQKLITLPYYVDSFATDFTVTVTPIYNGTLRLLNCSKVKDNYFTVYGSEGEFDWSVFGKRADINVEPYKNAVVVKGDGPYKYL